MVTKMLVYDDCISQMEKLISNDIVFDAIISDVPYNIGQDKWDKDFPICKAIELCYKLLKHDGNIIIFQGYSNVVFTMNEMNKYFTFQDWIIYDRIKGRGGKRHLVSTREDILWYSKGDNYTFNKIPSTIKKKTGGLGMKNGCEFRALSNVWTDISPIVPWSKERVNHPTKLHRLIMGVINTSKPFIDHINGNTLDNRKQNLRLATNQQNNMNTRVSKNNRLKCKGVTQVKTGKYVARIRYNGKLIHIGTFSTLEEATEARRLKENELYGEFSSFLSRGEANG